jgi:DNA repair exonuclease SbcCD nuclease subunit
MRIGVFSDTHIGRCVPRAIGELKRQAYRHAFTQAVDVFIREEIDYLIHAGDMFEKRSMIPEESVFVKDELQRLVDSIRDARAKDVMMFAIRGNHDGTPENNALDFIRHPLAEYLKIIGDKTLQGEDEAEVHNGLFLSGVAYHPYISRKFEEIKATIKRGFEHESRVKILLIHNFIKGHHQIPPGVPPHNCLEVEDLKNLKVDLVIAGHHHNRKETEIGNGAVLLTPGATEAIDLSDEGSYGVYILEGKNSPRFVPIEPLHEIHNIRVDSRETIRPAEWFVDKAIEEVGARAYSAQARDSEAVLRVLLLGLTDEDPFEIERSLTSRLGKMRGSLSKILHMELVNRVEDMRRQIIPVTADGDRVTSEILTLLGNMSQDAAKIVEEVSMALDERASQTTGLLTASDRLPFVNRWINILEKVEATG